MKKLIILMAFVAALAVSCAAGNSNVGQPEGPAHDRPASNPEG